MLTSTAVLAVPVLPAAAVPRTAPGRDCAAVAERHLATMTPEQKVGQLVMVGGPRADVRRAVAELHAGVASLSDAPDPRAAAEYANGMRAAATGVPILVGGDFEHGAAHNIRTGTTALPRPMGLGAARDPAKAATAAGITAAELRLAGVRLTLAPVADVESRPDRPFGVRSFGQDPELVSRLTAAQVRAYRAAGVAAAVKHFPGHGGADVDAHLELPTVDADRETLERTAFPPFRAAVAAGAPVLMTAHILLTAIDPELPATLSPAVVSGVLRGDLGYTGVVITDSVQMGAIRQRWGVVDGSVLAIRAGADVVLSTGPFTDHAAITHALRDRLSPERIEESAARVLRLKCVYGAFDRRPADPELAAALSGTRGARKAARAIARDSITVLDNSSGALPFRRDARTLVAGVLDTEALARHLGAEWWQAGGADPTDAEIAEAVARARDVDQVLVATYARTAALPPGQARLVRALAATGTRVAAVSIGVPHDVTAYPDLGAALAAYAQTFVWDTQPPANDTVLGAVADVVFGARAGGRLPVHLSEELPYGHSAAAPAPVAQSPGVTRPPS
ncbi:beta-N-acetylhexosaminidase [Amycolatopsis arida]|uniref:beta-N-acetylhexosaminidase n=1 Tax=Amycolatopsis arida TaxID=587909 RepID=A0A1I5M3R7_9PSEU|nr:glycoside hydrolase family 3 N-terminal domain-containing protein [Amycolatopsis arida]TDX93956.1 beta-N-acetylhexosaminidase [Amycolatopsis arida]SFP04130.1 beta-N-acetylhexosaminidase [Amycolatopsis arida]